MIRIKPSAVARSFFFVFCVAVQTSPWIIRAAEGAVLSFTFPNLDPEILSEIALAEKHGDSEKFFVWENAKLKRQLYATEESTSRNKRFGGPSENYSSWSTKILNWGETPWRSAPVDLSFLNLPEKPAGKHGFLHAVKDKLVFEDGTEVRFWGTNLTAYALFGMTSHEDVRRQARRLSQLGFNLVRFHHHDSSWVNPNIFGDANGRDTKSLSSVMLQRLDWWIKCLEDEGIYIWLDLEVGRHLKPGDGIENFDEISKGKSDIGLKGYNYVNASIEHAMQRFNESYVTHFNSFTGLSYKDDPAIVTLLLTNENDITHHFGNNLLPDHNVPRHNAIYMAEAYAFAEKHGLPKSEVWRSWKPGPPKLFLNDLERRFDVEMIKHLRELGVKVPIVTTSFWGDESLSSLPALTAGNLIDVHSYGSAGELEVNPLHAANMVDRIAAAHVVNRPLSVSEWNVEPFPVPDRHVIPLYIASSASLQGWNALMQYAYSQHPIVDRGEPSNWQAFNDPALMATLPAAALLYRRHDVQEANTTYIFVPTEAQLFNQTILLANAVALRTAAEKGKLMIAMPRTKELPWLEQSRVSVGAPVITDPDNSLIVIDAKESVSDTGELARNWEEGIFTINTPRSQVAMGQIGGKPINLADVDIAISTPNATVAIQSMDGKNLQGSNAILISLGAGSVPNAANGMPFYSEPVIGTLTIRARPGLKLYPQFGTGMSEEAIDLPYEDGRYQINLNRSLGTYWLVLK